MTLNNLPIIASLVLFAIVALFVFLLLWAERPKGWKSPVTGKTYKSPAELPYVKAKLEDPEAVKRAWETQQQGWGPKPGWTRLDVLPREEFMGPDVPRTATGKPILPGSPQESYAQVKSFANLWHPDPKLPLRDRLKEWKTRAQVVSAQSGHPAQKLDYEAMLLDMLESIETIYGGIIDALFTEEPEQPEP